MAFVLRVLINGVAIWFATLVLPGLEIVGARHRAGSTVGIILLIALVFGIVNAIVKPIVAFLSIPLYILTLGLFTHHRERPDAHAHRVDHRVDRLGSADRQLRDRLLGRDHHLDRQLRALASLIPDEPPGASTQAASTTTTARTVGQACRRAPTTAGSRVAWNCRVTAVVPGGPSTAGTAASNCRIAGLPASPASAARRS